MYLALVHLQYISVTYTLPFKHMMYKFVVYSVSQMIYQELKNSMYMNIVKLRVF